MAPDAATGRRVVAAVATAVLVGVALGGCGGNSGVAPGPSDQALGVTANRVLAATEGHDLRAVCRLTPTDFLRRLGGRSGCERPGAAAFPGRAADAAGAPIQYLVGARPGPVRAVDEVSDRLRETLDRGERAWLVRVGGGRRRSLGSEEMRIVFEQLEPRDRVVRRALAERGVQCVLVVLEPGRLLRGAWDPLCANLPR